jgi:hypothetical protein
MHPCDYYVHEFRSPVFTFPRVVTLCGSTRFKAEFEAAYRDLSLQGAIVLTVTQFTHADGIAHTEEQKAAFDNLHLRKIDLSDEIYVINKNGYIGESTRREIEYAELSEKVVTYLEPPLA